MDKTRRCIDCGKKLVNMRPLAKRCKECRRKFQDKVSYDIKKMQRTNVKKKNILKKVKEQGLIDEIAEEIEEKRTAKLKSKTEPWYLKSTSPSYSSISKENLFTDKSN